MCQLNDVTLADDTYAMVPDAHFVYYDKTALPEVSVYDIAKVCADEYQTVV